MKVLSARFGVISALVVLAISTRFIPHPPNFTALTAVALFSGACFDRKYLAFVVPFAAMFLSDLFLELTTGWGFHANMFSVYLSFGLIALIGSKFNRSQKVGPLSISVLASAMIFFVLTNFSVWMTGSFYPHSLAGLMACYVAAIPFAINQIAGDVFFTSALFCSWWVAQISSPPLRAQHPVEIKGI